MMTNYDVVKEAFDVIEAQRIENKELKRDNLALVSGLWLTVLMVFFYAAWN